MAYSDALILFHSQTVKAVPLLPAGVASRRTFMRGGLSCRLWSYSLGVLSVAGSVQVVGLIKCWEKYLWGH